jgi:hypothetical protein
MPNLGHLLGRLFGGDSDRQAALLRAYGKLPFYAEYRRLDLSPGTATAFSRWLDEGRLAWVSSPSRDPNGATRAARMVLTLSDPRELVVASVWDSRDSLGRSFPFAFFVLCSPDALGSGVLERWASACAIHDQFQELFAELHRIGKGGDFYKLYQKRGVRLRPDDVSQRVDAMSRAARSIDSSAWCQAMGLEQETSPPEWFAGLLRRSQRWTHDAQPIDDLALSCPLSSACPYSAQIPLWLTWIEGLIQRHGRLPQLLAPTDDVDPPAAVHVIFRDLLPDDYQLLTTDEPSYAYVDHLRRVPLASGERGAAAAVPVPDGSILDWLSATAPLRV